MWGKILLGVGLAGLLLSSCVCGVFTVLPLMGPHTKWEEAAWGIVPGACCSSLFLVATIAGAVLLVMGNKAEATSKAKS